MSVIDYLRKLAEAVERVDKIDADFNRALAEVDDPTDEELMQALVDEFFDVKYEQLQARKRKLLQWLRMDRRRQGGDGA